jgi:hypothetical protein
MILILCEAHTYRIESYRGTCDHFVNRRQFRHYRYERWAATKLGLVRGYSPCVIEVLPIQPCMLSERHKNATP